MGWRLRGDSKVESNGKDKNGVENREKMKEEST